MQLRFATVEAPMTLRVCRSLVWTQAMLVVLGGLFVLLTVMLFGDGNSIPFGGRTLSGTGAAVLGGAYVAAGLTLAGLGAAVGRLAPWARTVLVSVEVFVAGLLVFRSLDLSLSTLVNVAFVAAIVGLLFAPDSNRALSGAGPDAATTTSVIPPI